MKVNNSERKGVSMIEFSADGKFICSRSEEFPNILWVWNVDSLSLYSVIVNINSIKKFNWDPAFNRLAYCSGESNQMYMWTEEGCSVHIPEKSFKVNSFSWRIDGKGLVLNGESHFCCCFVDF
jgi:hypothetical protein